MIIVKIMFIYKNLIANRHSCSVDFVNLFKIYEFLNFNLLNIMILIYISYTRQREDFKCQFVFHTFNPTEVALTSFLDVISRLI